MAPDSIQVMTDINQYLSFIFKLIFAFGIAFEIPIATILLVKSGITSKASLVKARPYLLVLFLIIGMLLTPPDIFSQLFLAIPMWILFELGIFFIREK
jgi:sec-independent protein translocase protein TatC